MAQGTENDEPTRCTLLGIWSHISRDAKSNITATWEIELESTFTNL